MARVRFCGSEHEPCAAPSVASVDLGMMSVSITRCPGVHFADEQHAPESKIVLTLRGAFAWRLGRQQYLVDPNQILLITRDQSFRTSHPVAGGDDTLAIHVDERTLDEIGELSRTNVRRAFAPVCRPKPPALGVAAALLARAVRAGTNVGVCNLALQEIALNVLRSAFQGPDVRPSAPSARRLVERARQYLASRRGICGLSEVGEAVGVSPVYLTQLFKAVEGVPLYRYALRMRLAASLQEVATSDDLTEVANELGFASHSHFTTTFRREFGLSPSGFRALVR